MKTVNLHFTVDPATGSEFVAFDYFSYFGDMLHRPIAIQTTNTSVTGYSAPLFFVGVTNTVPHDLTIANILGGTLTGEVLGFVQPVAADNALVFNSNRKEFSETTKNQSWRYIVVINANVGTSLDNAPEITFTIEDRKGVTDGAESNLLEISISAHGRFQDTLLHFPVVESSLTVTSNGAEVATDDGLGAMIGDVDVGGTNTITYATGALDVTFTDPEISTLATADYTYSTDVVAEALMASGCGRFQDTTSLAPVLENHFTATSNTGQVVTDDGAGNIIGDIDAGGTNTINYTTGDYDFTFVDKQLSTAADIVFVHATLNESLTASNNGRFSDTIVNTPIYPTSLVLTSNSGKIIGDNGAGQCTGDVDFSRTRTINYATGALTVCFNDAELSATATASYEVTVDNEALVHSGLGVYNNTAAHTKIEPGTFHATSNTGKLVTDNGLGALVGNVHPTGTNTINYTTGAYNFKYIDSAASSSATADYRYNIDNEVINPAVVGTFVNTLGTIHPSTFTATSNTGKIITDNGAGALTGDIFIGENNTINYATGYVRLTFEDGASSVTATADFGDSTTEDLAVQDLDVGIFCAPMLTGTPITPSSFTATSNTGKIITDDGAGNLVGDIDAGGTNTIDYATGDYTMYFEDGVLSTSATADYTYTTDVTGEVIRPFF